MKASLKFREDQRPLARAKIPIGVLGLPFSSGVSAGDARELRLDLSTAFDYGPSIRVSYRPNDQWNPFSLVLKTGTGPFGSPIAAPMSMSAEFNLLSRDGAGGSPAFSILFKPRFGDFCIKKTTGSASVAPRKVPLAPDADVNPVNGIETSANRFWPVNGIDSGKKFNGFPTEIASARGTINELLSGGEVTARSVLPLRSSVTVRFHWGLKVPPEFRTSTTSEISLSKLPLLVMNKISIEHVAAAVKTKDKEKSGVDVAEALLSVKRQLEFLQAENGLLRTAVEDLRTNFFVGRKGVSATGNQVQGGSDISKGSGKAVAGKSDRRSDGKTAEIAGRAKMEDVNEELRKALMGATTAGGI